MRRSSAYVAALLLLSGAGLSRTRDARSDTDSTAKQAEVAYAAVDFARTRELATSALIHGGNSARQTERLYFLLGIADAALGQNSEARNAFIALLAINPKLHLDRTLSPKLRAPYAEAVGFWSSSSEKLAATATPSASGDELVVEISDPVDMVKLVAVQSRAAGEDFTTSVHPASASQELGIALGNQREFVINLLDEHKNSIFQLGSRAKPLRFLPKRDELKPPLEVRRQETSSSLTIVGGVLTTLGAVGIGSAIPFHLERNQKAKEWNSGACEAPVGLSRAQQCSTVNTARQKAEERAIVLYATGGALLAGGFVTLLLAPNARDGTEQALACEASFTSVLRALLGARLTLSVPSARVRLSCFDPARGVVGPLDSGRIPAHFPLRCCEHAENSFCKEPQVAIPRVYLMKRTPETCVPRGQWDIQRDTPWGRMKYIDYKRRMEFDEAQYREIDRFCRIEGVDWFASCWDVESVDFMERFAPQCYNIASASVTDMEL